MENSGEISLDHVFDALTDVERRRLLLALRGETPLEVSSAGGTGAGTESGPERGSGRKDGSSLENGSGPEDRPTSGDGSGLEEGAGSGGDSGPLERRVAMQHLHLPKLADYGLIEWDRDGDVVARGPRFEEIGPLLDLLADHGEELSEC